MEIAKRIMNRPTMIKWAITIILTLITIAIPEIGWYTGKVKGFFIITILALGTIAFELLPNAVIALLLPALYAFFKITDINVAMSPWLGTTMLLCIGAFLLAAELQTSGLLTRIAYYLMSKVNGSYLKMLIMIYLVGFIISALTFGNAYIIMGALCAGLCFSMDASRTKLGAGIGFACMVGSISAKVCIFPPSTYAVVNGASGGMLDDSGFSIPMSFIHNLPVFFVFLISIVICAKWYKPEIALNDTDFFKTGLEKLGKITIQEKKIALILVLVMIYVFTTNFHGLALDYGFAIIPWLAFLPFIKAADENTLKQINWEMVFFVAGCMSIGNVATDIGVGAILANSMMGLFQRGNPFIVFGAVLLVVFVLNLILTPMAIWSMISAPILQVADMLGWSELPFLYSLQVCAELIIFPYEFVPYLIVFSFGMMTMGDFIRLSVMKCAVFFIGFMVLVIPWWMLMGLL